MAERAGMPPPPPGFVLDVPRLRYLQDLYEQGIQVYPDQPVQFDPSVPTTPIRYPLPEPEGAAPQKPSELLQPAPTRPQVPIRDEPAAAFGPPNLPTGPRPPIRDEPAAAFGPPNLPTGPRPPIRDEPAEAFGQAPTRPQVPIRDEPAAAFGPPNLPTGPRPPIRDEPAEAFGQAGLPERPDQPSGYVPIPGVVVPDEPAEAFGQPGLPERPDQPSGYVPIPGVVVPPAVKRTANPVEYAVRGRAPTLLASAMRGAEWVSENLGQTRTGELAGALAELAEDAAAKIKFAPEIPWEEADTPLKLARWGIDTGIVSSPDMLAAVANMPAYAVARTHELAAERARADGRTEVTGPDMAAGLVTSIASATLERIGGRASLFGTVGRTAPGRIAGAVGAEAGTEAAQEIIEVAGTRAGTEAGLPAAPEMVERLQQVAVAGGTMGWAVRAPTEVVSAVLPQRPAAGTAGRSLPTLPSAAPAAAAGRASAPEPPRLPGEPRRPVMQIDLSGAPVQPGEVPRGGLPGGQPAPQPTPTRRPRLTMEAARAQLAGQRRGALPAPTPQGFEMVGRPETVPPETAVTPPPTAQPALSAPRPAEPRQQPVAPTEAPAPAEAPSALKVDRDRIRQYAAEVVSPDITSVTMVGSAAAKKVNPNDIDMLYEMPGVEPTADAVTEAIERSNIDLDTYDTFIKVGDRYFVVTAGAGREVVENTDWAQQQAGRPIEVMARSPKGWRREEEESKRFDAGRALTANERKQTLDTLTDRYKEMGVDKEHYVDARGEDRYRYPYTPSAFRKSDVTGAMLRYYVTLPDGRIAHPTELFPDYTQAQVDKEMARREAGARETRAWVDDRTKPEQQFDTIAEAQRYWQQKSDASRATSAGGWPTVYGPDKREVFGNAEGKIVLLPGGPDWLTGERVEALADAGWKRQGQPTTEQTEAAPGPGAAAQPAGREGAAGAEGAGLTAEQRRLSQEIQELQEKRRKQNMGALVLVAREKRRLGEPDPDSIDNLSMREIERLAPRAAAQIRETDQQISEKARQLAATVQAPAPRPAEPRQQPVAPTEAPAPAEGREPLTWWSTGYAHQQAANLPSGHAVKVSRQPVGGTIADMEAAERKGLPWRVEITREGPLGPGTTPITVARTGYVFDSMAAAKAAATDWREGESIQEPAPAPAPVAAEADKGRERPETAPTELPASPEPTDAEPALTIEPHSDTALIIRGQTRENRDRIKGANILARWNKRAGGWVFPRRFEDRARGALGDLMGGEVAAAPTVPEPSAGDRAEAETSKRQAPAAPQQAVPREAATKTPEAAAPEVAAPEPYFGGRVPTSTRGMTSRPKPAAKKPRSLFQFLRSRGGVQDTTGELRAMDLHKLRGQAAIIKAGGMDPDKAREAAAEAGYLPEDADLSDLFEAMRREAAGKPVYMPEQGAAVGEARSDVEAAESRLQAQERVKAHMAELGESLGKADMTAIHDAMDANPNLDAETAVEDHVERQAINTLADLSGETGDDSFLEDIPFEALTGQPGARGEGPAGEAADEAAGGEAGQAAGEAVRPAGEPVTTEQTKAGEQTVIPGAERISERELAERRMRARDVRGGQRGVEGLGLFDPEARPGRQREIF